MKHVLKLKWIGLVVVLTAAVFLISVKIVSAQTEQHQTSKFWGETCEWKELESTGICEKRCKYQVFWVTVDKDYLDKNSSATLCINVK
jgi:hypothetical protein